MPELPDVEGYRVHLTERLRGRRVRHVHVLDAGVLRNVGARSFTARLSGRRFGTPDRHGKWLLLPTDGPTMIVHSGMTGRPYVIASDADAQPYDRLCLTLDRGEFHYADLRKLRGIWLADDERAIGRVIGDTGPDALQVEAEDFRALVAGRRRVKSTLTDQSVLAGLGNLLSDEICWQARVHPLRPGDRLSDDEVRRLHTTMCRVLRTSVRHGEVPHLRSWLTRVRDDGEARCPRCGTPLARTRNAGRATVWCPQCQPD